MADPEPSPLPALAPPLPSTSRPVRTHCPAKGKEPEVLVDSLPHLRAKASGSLRGMKRRVPSPALAGPQDVDEDLPGTLELPEVQVECALSQQGSEDLQARSESIAIGEVSLTYLYKLHPLTTQIGSLWTLPNLQYC